MYQVQFRLGLDPLQTPLGELTALPQTPSWIKGPTSKGRGGDGKGRGEGKGGNGKRRGRLGEGKGRHETPFTPPIHISVYAPGFDLAWFRCLPSQRLRIFGLHDAIYVCM